MLSEWFKFLTPPVDQNLLTFLAVSKTGKLVLKNNNSVGFGCWGGLDEPNNVVEEAEVLGFSVFFGSVTIDGSMSKVELFLKQTVKWFLTDIVSENIEVFVGS